MFGLGATEILMLAVLGVLLFGKNLPTVGRSLGKTLMEFKNGLRGVEDEFRDAFHESERTSPPVPSRPPERVATTEPNVETAAS